MLVLFWFECVYIRYFNSNAPTVTASSETLRHWWQHWSARFYPSPLNSCLVAHSATKESKNRLVVFCVDWASNPCTFYYSFIWISWLKLWLKVSSNCASFSLKNDTSFAIHLRVGWEGYFLLNLMICDMKGSGQSEPIPSPEKRPTRIVYRSPTCQQQWHRSVAQVTTAPSLISLGWAKSNHILVSTSLAYRRILCWFILIQIIMLIMARKCVYFAWKPRSELRILEQRHRTWGRNPSGIEFKSNKHWLQKLLHSKI